MSSISSLIKLENILECDLERRICKLVSATVSRIPVLASQSKVEVITDLKKLETDIHNDIARMVSSNAVVGRVSPKGVVYTTLPNITIGNDEMVMDYSGVDKFKNKYIQALQSLARVLVDLQKDDPRVDCKLIINKLSKIEVVVAK